MQWTYFTMLLMRYIYETPCRVIVQKWNRMGLLRHHNEFHCKLTNSSQLNSVLWANQKILLFYIIINVFHDIWFLIWSVYFSLIWVRTRILQKHNGHIERNVKKPLLKSNLHLSTCQLNHTGAGQMKTLKNEKNKTHLRAAVNAPCHEHGLESTYAECRYAIVLKHDTDLSNLSALN